MNVPLQNLAEARRPEPCPFAATLPVVISFASIGESAPLSLRNTSALFREAHPASTAEHQGIAFVATAV